VCVCVCVCVCLFQCVRACLYVYFCVYLCVCIWLRVCVYLCVCFCVCAFGWICVCVWKRESESKSHCASVIVNVFVPQCVCHHWFSSTIYVYVKKSVRALKNTLTWRARESVCVCENERVCFFTVFNVGLLTYPHAHSPVQAAGVDHLAPSDFPDPLAISRSSTFCKRANGIYDESQHFYWRLAGTSLHNQAYGLSLSMEELKTSLILSNVSCPLKSFWRLRPVPGRWDSKCRMLIPAGKKSSLTMMKRNRKRKRIKRTGAKRRHIAGRAYDTGHDGSKATSKWQWARITLHAGSIKISLSQQNKFRLCWQQRGRRAERTNAKYDWQAGFLAKGKVHKHTITRIKGWHTRHSGNSWNFWLRA